MQLHGEFARLRLLWRPMVIKRYLKQNKQALLHIGCGGHNVSGWLNVDKFAANADTYLNAYKRFPFEDNTFSLIFTEHMIEHLEIDKVQHFMSEVHRVLKPGGICRITCPDLELYAKNYISKDKEFFDKIMEGIADKRRKRPDLTWIVRTNGAAFMTGVVKNFHKHRWMYDYETLDACLSEIGFKSTSRKSFHDSEEPKLADMDHPDRAHESLYIEAVK